MPGNKTSPGSTARDRRRLPLRQHSGRSGSRITGRDRVAALSADASFRKVKVGDEKAVYAFVREKVGKKVFVILNLSANEQSITVSDKTLLGKPYNLFMGTKEPLTNKSWNIEPWGYVVYEY